MHGMYVKITCKNVEIVIIVFTIMIGSQIQRRYPVITHTADGVRGDGVTRVDDACESL
jgi:hypothetical protein